MEILLFSWFYATSSCPSQFHLLLHISSTRNGRVFITSLPQEVIRCQYPQIIIPVINFFSHSRFGIKVPTESKFYEFFLPGLSFSESRWVAQLGGRVVEFQFHFNILIETTRRPPFVFTQFPISRVFGTTSVSFVRSVGYTILIPCPVHCSWYTSAHLSSAWIFSRMQSIRFPLQLSPSDNNNHSSILSVSSSSSYLPGFRAARKSS